MASGQSFTEQLIGAAVQKFTAPQGEKTIFAGGRMMRVNTSGERMIHLPNGETIRVTIDDSGTVTQVEEDDRLHAIVRPPTFTYQIGPR